MKLVQIVFLVFTTYINAEDPTLEYVEAKDQCVIELKLNPELYKKIPNWEKDDVLNHDDKCLIRCMFRNLGFLTTQDIISEEFAKEAGITQKELKICEQKLTSECEGAYEMLDCLSDLKEWHNNTSM